MAWDYFPLTAGKWLTSTVLHELYDAAVERGLSSPTALSEPQAGWWTGKIRTFLTNLVGNINSQIPLSGSSGSVWCYVEDWTDEDTYEFGMYTRAASPPTGKRNIFADAFGDSSTDWRVPVDGWLTAQCLNDIYLVLRKLRIKNLSIFNQGTSVDSGRGLNNQTSCSAALNGVDSLSWSSSALSGMLHGVTIGSLVVNLNTLWFCDQGRQGAWRTITAASVECATRLYLNVGLSAGIDGATQQATGRSLGVDIRSGSGSASWANWSALAGFGSSIATFDVASGSVLSDLHRKSYQLDSWPTAPFVIVLVPQSYNASGSGLCTYGNGYTEILRRDTGSSVHADCVIAVNGNYAKPGDAE
jgi:hypothetical protein